MEHRQAKSTLVPQTADANRSLFKATAFSVRLVESGGSELSERPIADRRS